MRLVAAPSPKPWLLLAALFFTFTPGASGAGGGAGQQLAFGVKMAQRGLWSEALFRFQQARELDPDNPRILNNLAVAYEALARFDDALEAYREALRLDPGNRELKRNYGRFIEFYQSFRPRAETDAAGEEPGGGADEGSEGSSDGR